MALTLGKITVGGQLILRMDDGTEVDLGRVERELDLRLDMAGSVEIPLPPLGEAVAPEPEEHSRGPVIPKELAPDVRVRVNRGGLFGGREGVVRLRLPSDDSHPVWSVRLDDHERAVAFAAEELEPLE